jgi:hypothetical protein
MLALDAPAAASSFYLTQHVMKEGEPNSISSHFCTFLSLIIPHMLNVCSR